MAGRVFAFTAPVGHGNQDQKHHIVNMDDLRSFCKTFLGEELGTVMDDAREVRGADSS